MKLTNLKAFAQSHRESLKKLLPLLNRLRFSNRLGRKTDLQMGACLLRGVTVEDGGTDNHIIIEDFVQLRNCQFIFHGSHNTVHIGPRVYGKDAAFFMEDEGNRITLGEHTYICGETVFSAIEGTAIEIGRECLFSGGIQFRTGDSHSVLNLEGKRINPSEDIRIGDHVWVGTKVTCLKGVTVAEDSIVAATATLTGRYETPNSAIGGVPAKILKTGVNWCTQRIPIEK